MVNREPVKRFADARGFVFEPIGEDLLIQQRNVHVVLTRPGAIRGNHFHRLGTETLVVCGPARVTIRSGEDTETFTVPTDATYRVTIPPGVSHAIQNVGETDSLLVAFNTIPHDPEHPDLVPDLLLPA